MMIRQGEVLLIKMDEIPQNYQVTTVNGAKLAIGETGNAHMLTATGVEWFHDTIEDINEIDHLGATVAKNRLFVRVTGDDGVIRHSDRTGGHTEAPVPEGLYLVAIKREQMPWEDEARYVAD